MNQFTRAPGNKTEKVDYESMSFRQLKSDPVAGPILEQMALQYLKTKDKYWFEKKFTGEFDSRGFLIARTERYRNSKPSDNLSGSASQGEVERMTKDELKRLN